MNALETIRAILADDINPRTVRLAFKALRDAFPADTASVAMDDDTRHIVRDIFSEAESNTKLALSDAASDAYFTIGLSLAPAAENGLRTASGKRIDLCPKRSDACSAICLFGTGHARVARNVKRARIAKSRLYVLQQDYFKARMVCEVARSVLKARSKGRQLVVRLNVFSDIAWERKFPELFDIFPDVRFYDYTKISSRIGRTAPNYHLTFSRSESNEDVAIGMLHRGVNVAVVFEDHSFPETWNGFPVIDGTAHDLRILDPIGVVVGLAEKDTELHGPKYAGKRNTMIETAGFVLPTITSNVHGQPIPAF